MYTMSIEEDIIDKLPFKVNAIICGTADTLVIEKDKNLITARYEEPDEAGDYCKRIMKLSFIVEKLNTKEWIIIEQEEIW